MGLRNEQYLGSHTQPFRKEAQRRPRGRTATIGSIVEHHHYFLVRRHGLHDMLDELDEALAVLAGLGLVQHRARAPGVSVEDVYELGRTWGSDDCPPALSWLTINAFTASDKVRITVSPGYFELDSIV